MRRKKGFYSISAVAKMFSVHQQTIRMYEKEGLITPKRSAGNTRLFAEEDVERLEEVIYLTHNLGVNLAGVEIILKLQRKMKKMQDEMNKLFNAAGGELEQERLAITGDAKKQAQRLADIYQEKQIVKEPQKLLKNAPPVVDEEFEKFHTKYKKKNGSDDKKSESDDVIDDIEIEYDDHRRK